MCEEETSFLEMSDCEVSHNSDIQWEWDRRQDQFHKIGYRDGVIAGKEVAAQKGFNGGYKESVLVGYNWGFVRGVTRALASLPEEVKCMVVGKEEKLEKLERLYEAVGLITAQDALQLFNNNNINFLTGDHILHHHFLTLQSILSDSPALVLHFPHLHSTV